MTIKSDRGNLLYIAFSYLVFLFVGGLFVVENDGLTSVVYMGLCVWIVGSIFCTRWYIAVFREIIIGPSGITISLFHWSQFYSWDLMSICYESYQDRLGLRTQYKSAIVFAPSKIKKPKYMPPIMYCIIFHPYSFSFIHFYEEKRSKDAPNVYPVRKQEFIEKMNTWGAINSDFFNPTSGETG